MIPHKYFPFTKPEYELKIGAAPLKADEPVIETDENLAQELKLKQDCFAHNANYYFQQLPGSQDAQAEVLAYLGLGDAGTQPPLRAAGDRVQEDLLLLDANRPGLPLIAGHLCFANAWCLDDKLGKPFMAIHDPVPGFASSIGPPSEKLLERLKPGRPVWRLNWAVKSTGQLDLTNRWDAMVADCNARVTAENAGQTCWMRAERQTLSRLPLTNTVLFTVRTYTQPVATLSSEQQSILLGVLRTCPETMLRYKGIWPFVVPLVQHLSLQCIQ